MIEESWFNPYTPVWNYFIALALIAGFFMIGKYFWMLIYEIRFGLGDEYISNKLTPEEKRWLKQKYPLFGKYNKEKIKWSKK
jgi:hypothetical protein